MLISRKRLGSCDDNQEEIGVLCRYLGRECCLVLISRKRLGSCDDNQEEIGVLC